MVIHPYPQLRPSDAIFVQGDTLIIGGVEYDFSVIPDGAALPREAVDCDLIVGSIERVGGILHVPLIVATDRAGWASDPDPFTPGDGPLEMLQW
ncbi:MAG: hypothetical protein WBF88_17460 [Pusillimonas sp.]